MNQSNSLSPSEEEKEGEIARKFSTLHTQDMLIRVVGFMEPSKLGVYH